MNIIKSSNIIPLTDGPYLIFKDKDLFHHDYCLQKGSITELKNKCDMIQDCIGFNSLGYMKTHMSDVSILDEVKGCDLYIRQDRITEKIDRIIQGLVHRKSDITFIMTTCKRLNLALDTLDKFLFNCSDSHIISKWLIIDDSSSKADIKTMRKRYPFIEVIQKPPERKGHPQSLNLMMELVNTRYVILFEDDWRCCLPFSIQNYLHLMESNTIDQISLVGKNPCDYFESIAMLHGSTIYKYVFDSTHPELNNTKLKETYIRYMDEFGIQYVVDSKWEKRGYYHPGFTLNPGIFNLNKLKEWKLRFKEEDEYHDSFEVYFSFECLKRGWTVYFTNIRILHTGTENSAYVLNNNPRIFDTITPS